MFLNPCAEHCFHHWDSFNRILKKLYRDSITSKIELRSDKRKGKYSTVQYQKNI